MSFPTHILAFVYLAPGLSAYVHYHPVCPQLSARASLMCVELCGMDVLSVCVRVLFSLSELMYLSGHFWTLALVLMLV